jgi:hypothetical protein
VVRTSIEGVGSNSVPPDSRFGELLLVMAV